MNRITSVLAGTLTAALSGAVVAAAAVGQGVFDSEPTKPAPKAVETQQAQAWTPAAVASTAQATVEPLVQQPQQRIVYVDKEPIVMTRTIQQPAPANDSAQSAAPETATPSAPVATVPSATSEPKTAEKSQTPEPRPAAPRVFTPQGASGDQSGHDSAGDNRLTPPPTAAALAPTQPAATPAPTRRGDDAEHQSATTSRDHEAGHDD